MIWKTNNFKTKEKTTDKHINTVGPRDTSTFIYEKSEIRGKYERKIRL